MQVGKRKSTNDRGHKKEERPELSRCSVGPILVHVLDEQLPDIPEISSASPAASHRSISLPVVLFLLHESLHHHHHHHPLPPIAAASCLIASCQPSPLVTNCFAIWTNSSPTALHIESSACNRTLHQLLTNDSNAEDNRETRSNDQQSKDNEIFLLLRTS